MTELKLAPRSHSVRSAIHFDVTYHLETSRNKIVALNALLPVVKTAIRKLKQRRRQPWRKRPMKIRIWIGDDIVIIASSSYPIVDRARSKWTGRSAIEVQIHCCVFTLSLKPEIWKSHVVTWQTTSKNCTKVCAARVARLLFLMRPITSLFSSVVDDVAVAVVLA